MSNGITHAQADNLQREIIELRADTKKLRRQLTRHERQHAEDEAARRMSHRRVVTWGIAAVGAIDGPLVSLLLTRR